VKKIAIVGGGAAGYFVAANLGKTVGQQTILFEQANLPLQKVRISGGGRCNVTHACFDPLDLVEFYPRGKKELLSVFYTFQPGDTMAWFDERGVELKIEDDNRIFPVSDSSLSIIEALTKAVDKNKVQLNFSDGVQEINKVDGGYELITKSGKHFFETVIVTTGSTPKFWKSLKNIGLKIVQPVPSLFTFNCKDPRIEGLMGISFDNAEVKINQQKLEEEGPLLITHWGFTEINFVNQSKDEIISFLNDKKQVDAKKNVHKNNPFDFPKRFWFSILSYCSVDENKVYADLSKKHIEAIATELTQGKYQINGKSTFKDEFVTAGGVDLKEIDFHSMQAKKIPQLFMAGEVLNIDAITGGFNFQACWSEGYIISEKIKEIYQ